MELGVSGGLTSNVPDLGDTTHAIGMATSIEHLRQHEAATHATMQFRVLEVCELRQAWKMCRVQDGDEESVICYWLGSP
jgi:hypothetical protein